MTDQIDASHILMMYQGSLRSSSTRSKAAALSEMQALKRQVEEGGSFAELAQAHSDCPSGQAGGELGTFGRGTMVPEFDAAAFSLEVGQVSDVVETAFGYHLIQRTA